MFGLVYLSVSFAGTGPQPSVESQKGRRCEKVQVWSAESTPTGKKVKNLQKDTRLHQKAPNGAGRLFMETGIQFSKTRLQLKFFIRLGPRGPN